GGGGGVGGGGGQRGGGSGEIRGGCECPGRDRLAVLEASRERVLGREPVLHRDHGGAGAVREFTRDVVHEADAADAEPAAVEVDDEARRRLVVLVDTYRYPGDHFVMHPGDLARRRCAERRPREREQLGAEVGERVAHHRVRREPFLDPGVEHTFVVDHRTNIPPEASWRQEACPGMRPAGRQGSSEPPWTPVRKFLEPPSGNLSAPSGALGWVMDRSTSTHGAAPPWPMCWHRC